MIGEVLTASWFRRVWGRLCRRAGERLRGRLPGSGMVPTVQDPRKVVVGCTDHISLSSGITIPPKLIVYAVFTLSLY